jgi:hypothetical protein
MPRYIRIVRNALIRGGMSVGHATAVAINNIKKWARGEGNVSPKVQAAAKRALAEWDAMKREKGYDDDVYTKSSGLLGLDRGDVALLMELGALPDMARKSGREVKQNHSEDETKSVGDDMQIEHKCVPVSGVKVLDEARGLVETFVSVTGIVDNVKDIIEPGAYEKTLATRKPKGVWSHDWNTPISRTESIEELPPLHPDLPKTLPNGDPWPKEAGALKVLTEFNLETQRGKDAYSDVKFFGDDQEWSIGYQVPPGGATIDQKAGVRRIKHLDLYEYSPVLWGAMGAARSVGSVKEAQLEHMAFKHMFGPDYTVTLDMDKIDTFVAEMKAFAHDGSEVPDDTSLVEELEAAIAGEGKGMLSAENVVLVKNAIGALTELLTAMQSQEEPEAKDDEEEQTEVKELVVFLTEQKSAGAVEAEIADSMAEHASAFDEAIESGDQDAIEEHGNALLDIIDEGLDTAEGAEAEGLKSIAAAIHTICEKGAQVGQSDEYIQVDDDGNTIGTATITPREKSAAKPKDKDSEEVSEEEYDEEDEEKVVFDTTEVKDARAFLDSLS